MSINPKAYHELHALVANHTNNSIEQTLELINKAGLNGLNLPARAPVFYVADYSQHRYLYIDPLFQKMLGFDTEVVTSAAPLSFNGVWDKNDYKCFNETIFKEELRFLQDQPVENYHDFSFSYNYRVRTADGNCLVVLQRSTFISSGTGGKPLAGIGYIIDITDFKTDTSMVHTIEEVNQQNATFSKVPLFKSVHYPDKVDSVLSKRELEILAGVHDGLCSKEIAVKFNLSVNTVNNHRKNMLARTNTRNCSELIGYARKAGLLK